MIATAQDPLPDGDGLFPDSTLLFPADTMLALRAVDPQLEWNRQRLLGMGMLLVFGGLAYTFHQEAEVNYTAYLRSGDFEEMDRLFQESERYDRLTGWSYVGVELGFILTVMSFDTPWRSTKEEVQTE